MCGGIGVDELKVSKPFFSDTLERIWDNLLPILAHSSPVKKLPCELPPPTLTKYNHGKKRRSGHVR